MHDDWGIDQPHEFQICAIHQAAFHRNELLYIIAKTGSGKSAIPLTVGTLLTGVAVTLVPLVGLGSNQVTKSCNVANCVKASYIDEHHRKDAEKLCYCLDTMTEGQADYVTIFLYISPQSLQMDSPWYGVLRCIASKDFHCLVCIDEAYTVHQDDYFCPEFQTAEGTIQHRHGLLTIECSIIVMSATFRQVDQDIITALLGMPPSMVM
jgi:superfamily II DNA helicase RecQ